MKKRIKDKEKFCKIGLVTPYEGGNLGDGAIQEAVIKNLRERLPKINLVLFTLSPVKTEKLHGVTSFPVTGIYISSYSNSLNKAIKFGLRKASGNLQYHLIKDELKRSSALRRLLVPLWRFAKVFFTSLVYPGTEIRHILNTYRMLKEFDLIIVSGGGQIDDYWGGPMGHPFTLLKWAVLARVTGIKFVFLSVGVCSLESTLSRIFVKYALKLANYRSYRDSGSKRLLVNYRFTRNDNIAPDLAFSYGWPLLIKSNSKHFKSGVIRIGISPIVYLCESYWPKYNQIFFKNYMRSLNEFTIELLKRGYEIVLFASDRADSEVVERFMNLENLKQCNSERGNLQVVKTDYVKELVENISQLDCVVASRLHGVILSHLCGVPVLAVSYDRKVNEHMQIMEQMDFCLDIHRFETQELAAVFEVLVCDRQVIREKILKKVEKFKKKLGEQYDLLVGNTFGN